MMERDGSRFIVLLETDEKFMLVVWLFFLFVLSLCC